MSNRPVAQREHGRVGRGRPVFRRLRRTEVRGGSGEPDGNLVVAITFGGNQTCRGGKVNQRLDIPAIAAFLAPLLAG